MSHVVSFTIDEAAMTAAFANARDQLLRDAVEAAGFELQKCVREAVRKYTEAYFATGPGKAALDAALLPTLTRPIHV